jgi:phage-related minor tail protein
MQKQMEKGFGLMCDKINLIEGRVENASQQLEMLERQQADNSQRQM